MDIVNRRRGGNLIRMASDSELRSMLESGDIDTVLAAEAELQRRNAEPETWCEYWGVT